MKIYNICECCRSVYAVLDVEGPDLATETTGICEDCRNEIGGTVGASWINHFYN